MKTLVILMLNILAFSAASEEVSFWDGNVRVDANRANTYTATMHTRFAEIRSRYEVGGRFYSTGVINNFGIEDIVDASQEQIICAPNDKNFSSTFLAAAQRSRQSAHSEASSNPNQSTLDMIINYDSSNFGPNPSIVDDEIKKSLGSNSQGRFCYDVNDTSGVVDYRANDTASAEGVFCNNVDSNSSLNKVFSYTDPVSGFSCELDMEKPLKEGETKFIRQAQNVSSTVAQGIIGCYKDPINGGAAVAGLIPNPSSCNSSNRSTCINSCDWADDVVCNPVSMPRWGSNNECGGLGTVIFSGDLILVDSNNGTSFEPLTGKIYGGQAQMACQVVNESVVWVVLDNTCVEL